MLVCLLLSALLLLGCAGTGAGYPSSYDADTEETRQNLREFILMRPEYTQADHRNKRFFWGSPRKTQTNR